MLTTLLVFSLTGSPSPVSSRTTSSGLMRLVLPALIRTICPPNAWARGRYSRSGSMMISSSRLRNRPAISCLKVKLLPPPEVPRMNPFEFMCARRSATIRLPLLALLL